MSTKKWIVVYFPSDDTYSVLNTQSKIIKQCLVVEDGSTAKIKYPQGWYSGKILAQTGKP